MVVYPWPPSLRLAPHVCGGPRLVAGVVQHSVGLLV